MFLKSVQVRHLSAYRKSIGLSDDKDTRYVRHLALRAFGFMVLAMNISVKHRSINL
jgi:hypothetical protein